MQTVPFFCIIALFHVEHKTITSMGKNLTIEERDNMRMDVASIIILLRKVLDTAKSLGFVAKLFFPKYASFIAKVEEAINKLEKIIQAY